MNLITVYNSPGSLVLGPTETAVAAQNETRAAAEDYLLVVLVELA
jgi:hypothetical protein